jgi:hypothetical protein
VIVKTVASADVARVAEVWMSDTPCADSGEEARSDVRTQARITAS